MPLFRRQSEKCRKKQQRQEFLAQQDPEPKFDLSECELQAVPAGVYAICKILQKEALFLHGNWLKGLNDGGQISDLKHLRILDLHDNELKSLPEEIGCLERLQVLNVANNDLKKLPSSIGDLRSLQTFNVKGNKLNTLPDSLCNLPTLRLLDISSNELTKLPSRLAFVRTLETLILDADFFTYPASDLCKKGTEAIMKFLCSENGLEYQPPSVFLLEVMEPPRTLSSSCSDNCIKIYQDEARLLESVENYQQLMQKKRNESRALEQQLAEEHKLQDQLAATASSNRKNLFTTMTKDQALVDQTLSQLSSEKEADRKRFMEFLSIYEKQAENLLADMLMMNEKAKKTEALLDEMEKKEMEENNQFKVHWEEFQNLRRQEVLDAMNQMLNEYHIFEKQRQMVTDQQESYRKQVLEMEELSNTDQVDSFLTHRRNSHQVRLDTLAKHEELQKQAMEALQLAQDAKHSRISSQIAIIESELAQLTRVELEKKSMRMESEITHLNQKRIALTAMLSQLLEEQENRENELRKRLVEMEMQRDDGQIDYWLVQYQRLLDKKPQRLIDKESQLEISVKKILIQAGADDYLPTFARHRITIETMMQLDDSDLRQMGVHELGIRKAILKSIQHQNAEEQKLSKSQNMPLLPTSPGSELDIVEPSAPPSETPSSSACASTGVQRQLSVTARGINSECVVCMDKRSEVIFLPCGHVCSCSKCSISLIQCPMCRANIQQQIKLSISVPS